MAKACLIVDMPFDIDNSSPNFETEAVNDNDLDDTTTTVTVQSSNTTVAIF